MSNDYTLPEPAFRLTWKNAAYYVNRPSVGDTDCYTADQLHACAEHARAPLLARIAELEAELSDAKESEDALRRGVNWVASMRRAGREERDRLTRELAEAKARAVIPDGWVAVPLEPTAEMISEVESASRIGAIWTAASAYRAMLSARPEFPPNGLPNKESGE